MQKIVFRAMGCNIAAIIDRDDAQTAKGLEQVPAWFEEWEQILSRFRPDSELSRLNASAGLPFVIGPVLLEVLTLALNAAEWTEGLVTPALLRPLELAGYDRSFDLLQSAWPGQRSGQIYSRTMLESDLSLADEWREINLDVSRHTITLLKGMKIDLGGVAKGWAAAEAARRLSQFGPALVDAGGDIGVSGPMASGLPWIIEVADPLQMQQNLGLLALDHGGVATSGVDYRRWLHDGNWKHHIIDPRTQQPAETDLMCASIIAPDLCRAEAAAKAAMIKGSLAGMDWLEDQPDLHGLFVLQDGRILLSSGMHEFIRRN